MKRNINIALTSIMIAGLLTGCGQASDIGKDKAAEIALTDANLTDADVTRLRVSKDRDDGQNIYEVVFTNENTEYEYEILASNGEILSVDYEESPVPNQQSQTGQQAQDDRQDVDGGQKTDGQTAAFMIAQPSVRLCMELCSKYRIKDQRNPLLRATENKSARIVGLIYLHPQFLSIAGLHA